MPEIVISADTTDIFKIRLHVDKFWQRQDLLYDYKVELTGVGNKSQINADDNIVIFALLIFCLHKLSIEAHAYSHYTSLLCFALYIAYYGRPIESRI